MGAPNVYDTSYVDSGPGVGVSNNASTGMSKDYTPEYSDNSSSTLGNVSKVKNSIYNVARSVANQAGFGTSIYADKIREAMANPATSAYSANLYDAFTGSFGESFDMDEYYDKLLDLAKYNNKWSAEQAEKQMDFQKASADKAMNFEDSQALRQMNYQSSENRKAMAWSAQEAMKSREWTERLSDTAHQREVKDLISAGLNPILSANNGAYSGSGATGQAFAGSGSSGSGHSSSGAMGNTDMGVTGSMAGMMNGIINNASNLAIAKLGYQASRYSTDMNYAMAKLSAGASIYNNNNSVTAQKAIAHLNRDTDIQKANISADATRNAAATSAGAVTSAAATSAAAARYSAEKHAEASKYSSERSLEASKYGSDRSLESKMYEVDRNIKTNPIGYIPAMTNDLSNAFSDVNNTYYPDFNDSWNYLGSE